MTESPARASPTTETDGKDWVGAAALECNQTPCTEDERRSRNQVSSEAAFAREVA